MNKHLSTLLIGFIFTSNIVFAQQITDRFESTFIKFEQEDLQKGYNSKTIIFTGSSSIKMWKTLKEDMAPMNVINRGFGGSTIPEVTAVADRILLPHHPKIIVFYCGENDLANDHTKPELALKSFKLFYSYMQENMPETKVFFIAIKPSISRAKYLNKLKEANQLIEKFIDKKDNYFFIDTASLMLDESGNVMQDIFIEDNLHMNAKGYTIWTKEIKPILKEYYLE